MCMKVACNARAGVTTIASGENRPEPRRPQLLVQSERTVRAAFNSGRWCDGSKASLSGCDGGGSSRSRGAGIRAAGDESRFDADGHPLRLSLDTKTNTIQGIMVDLITEIGKDAGFPVQIEPMQFSALVPSLTSNKIDIISAAMFATAARKEVIDFSDAVYTYGEGLVVPKTDPRLAPLRKTSRADPWAPRSGRPSSTR